MYDIGRAFVTLYFGRVCSVYRTGASSLEALTMTMPGDEVVRGKTDDESGKMYNRVALAISRPVTLRK